MKKFVTIFLAAALSLGLAVGASADFEGAIKKGTPTVDGALDAIYADSFNIQDLGTGDNGYAGTADDCNWSGTSQADVYFLYDDENLYICAVVEDDDVLSKGEAFCTGDNPWQNDNMEFRLSLDGTYDTIKVGIDAYGYNCYGLATHYDRIDYSSIKYATTYTETSYVLECSVPCTKGQLDMIKAGKLGFAYQLNDINADGQCEWFTTSFYGESPKTPVFVALSDEAATAAAPADTTTAAPVEDTTAAPVEDTTAAPAEDTTAAPAEDTTAAPAEDTTAAPAEDTTAAPAEDTTAAPAEDTTAAPAEDTTAAPAPAETTAAPAAPSAPTTAPSTFDPAIIAVALTAASGAAFVLASKKH